MFYYNFRNLSFFVESKCSEKLSIPANSFFGSSNPVYEGTDDVMQSVETASGDYPATV